MSSVSTLQSLLPPFPAETTPSLTAAGPPHSQCVRSAWKDPPLVPRSFSLTSRPERLSPQRPRLTALPESSTAHSQRWSGAGWYRGPLFPTPSHISSLKSATVGVFTPEILANTPNEGPLPPSKPVIEHLPATHRLSLPIPWAFSFSS